MLKAGNNRLEMHESTIERGAEHEAVGTHLHSEIWLVREGTAELTTNGVARTMAAGDVGICFAGAKHYISNSSDKPGTYFLGTVGPPRKYNQLRIKTSPLPPAPLPLGKYTH